VIPSMQFLEPFAPPIFSELKKDDMETQHDGNVEGAMGVSDGAKEGKTE
jgi:hypothetical protein